MAEISASLVKELREKTGAGMMDCKKALSETNGDIGKAIELLREKGIGKAANKSDRVAAEGLVSVEVSPDFKKATLSEINAETDFVAKNEGFINLTKNTTAHIHFNSIKTVEALHETSINGVKFEEYLKSQIATIGENLVVRRFVTISTDKNGVVNGYVHSNGRVGVIISAVCDSENTAQKSAEFIRNIAMHAAAMKPICLSYTSFDEDFVEKETVAIKAEIEKENEELKRLGKPLKRIPEFVSRSQISDNVLDKAKKDMENELKAQGKPEAIWNKIIPGQIERFIADNTQLDQRFTLLGQFYVMDDKKTIAQAIDEKAKELNGAITLVDYVRFELGEGVEKKETDFAAEVAAQLG